MRGMVVILVCTGSVVNLASGAGCDDLSFGDTVGSATYCNEPVDTGDGTVRNTSSGSSLTCVGVYLAWSVNLETIMIEFGENSATGDWEDDMVATCTTIAGQGSADWFVETTRQDWCGTAVATLVINYPCTSQQWWNHFQSVTWYDTCGSCE